MVSKEAGSFLVFVLTAAVRHGDITKSLQAEQGKAKSVSAGYLREVKSLLLKD